jgi:ABC-type cobalamin/Fe3+-siderophores transport system ATPase subunit
MLYIRNLEIEQVKCFANKQQIDFTGRDQRISQWTVILGENGIGKTTILRSIVSMLPPPQSFLAKRDHLDTSYILSIDSRQGYFWDMKRNDGERDSILKLRVSESEKPFGNDLELELDLHYDISHHRRTHDLIESKSTFDTRVLSPVYCFAYGATRRMGERSLKGDSFLRPNETLFDDEAFLQNPEELLLQSDYDSVKSGRGSGEFEKFKHLFMKVLPKGVSDVRISESGRMNREVQVKTSYGWVPIKDLGLGYKTTIAWLMDFASKMIYYHAKSANPFQEPAILLLDEIDLHMHPAWQRQIIENLSSLFPKTQFIVTAHSPLIAQAALNLNIVLLKKSFDHVNVINDPEIIRSWRIDQILTSDLFGLKYARPKEVEAKIDRRAVLIRKDQLTDIESQELARLNQEIDALPVGETKAEMDAIDVLRAFAKRIEDAKNNQNNIDDQDQ